MPEPINAQKGAPALPKESQPEHTLDGVLQRPRTEPTKSWKELSLPEQQAELKQAAKSQAFGWDWKDPRSAGNPNNTQSGPTQSAVSQPDGRQGERTADYTRDDRRRADLHQERQAERLQKRLGARSQIKSKAGKAASMVASGVIKQSHFFYLIAFVLALVGDILDFFVLSLPLFDFILGLLLLTLVYPYIHNPSVRLTTYFISLFDFVPGVGLLPLWAIATVYAWRSWAKEKRAGARAETPSRTRVSSSPGPYREEDEEIPTAQPYPQEKTA